MAQSRGSADAAQIDTTVFGNPYGAGGYENSLLNLKTGAAGVPLNRAAAGDVDPSFNPLLETAPGQVRVMAVQPDGKILAGGFFHTVNGVRYTNLVRLNADYSIDPTFSASVNAAMMAIAVQPDGKIVIGGFFTAVNGTGANFIARLLPNGAIDPSFNTPGASDAVYDLALQPDGKILVAGAFIGIGGVLCSYLARLNTDGSIDPGYVPPFPAPFPPTFATSIVNSISLQADGKLVIGGFVIRTNMPQTTSVFLRLNTDGSIDNSFDAGTVNGSGQKVLVQPDGKIMVGGTFTSIAGTPRNRIARLNANGSLDTSFDAGVGPNNRVNAINVRPDSSIWIGGDFSTVNGVARNKLALLSSTGALDNSFVPALNNTGLTYSLIPGAGGKLLAAGLLQSTSGPRDSLILFNADGSVDLSVNLNSVSLGSVSAVAVQPDGKIVVVGNFTRVNGGVRSRIARLNGDGTLDSTFVPTTVVNGPTLAMILQPDGKILIGGTTLIRLNTDGSRDTAFTQTGLTTQQIKAIAMQPDGKILIAYVAPSENVNGQGDISRLNSNGSLDASFDGPPLAFEAIAVLPNGKILAGGPVSIGYINSGTGQSEFHNGILRLNADGAHDRTFRSGFLSTNTGAGFTAVYDIEARPNGQILVAGALYTAVSPNTPAVVARLDSEGTIDGSFQLNLASNPYEYPRAKKVETLANGKILVAGLFDHIGVFTENNLARLNASGGIDSSFAAGTDGPIADLAVDISGKLLIGGNFETAGGVARTSLARFLNESAHRTAYDFDGDGKSDISVFRPSDGNWYLLGSTAGFSTVNFGIATDKLAPADYDGDGKTDVAVFRDGIWYIIGSQVGFVSYNFGAAGDIPQPADFTGDGKAELAVFRPADGVWYKLDVSGNAFSAVSFGQSGDQPVVGDYDGDGKADPAVFRSGIWYLLGSTQGFNAVNFGIAGDKPVPADYDGDGKTDPAVFRDGTWYLLRSSAGFTGVQFGQAGDLPAAADYDGDGKADVAVFRAGQWYLLPSGGGFTVVAFGSAGDKPIPGAFVS
jgi:uncharacterized delta-60 repeat protein